MVVDEFPDLRLVAQPGAGEQLGDLFLTQPRRLQLTQRPVRGYNLDNKNLKPFFAGPIHITQSSQDYNQEKNYISSFITHRTFADCASK